MKPRLKNPAFLVPHAMEPIQALAACAQKGPVPAATLGLVHLRSGQINGCSMCVDMHARLAEKQGETHERMFAVAAWRESPYFNDAERAALALTEAATRLADSDGVADAIWDEAARHFDEAGLAQLVLNIALSNFFNRLNATTRQIAGSVRWEG
jgi:AhpD family alkylhydroperoxidase